MTRKAYRLLGAAVALAAVLAPASSVLAQVKKWDQIKYPKLEPRNHWFDFIDCCLKGDKKPTANFEDIIRQYISDCAADPAALKGLQT